MPTLDNQGNDQKPTDSLINAHQEITKEIQATLKETPNVPWQQILQWAPCHFDRDILSHFKKILIARREQMKNKKKIDATDKMTKEMTDEDHIQEARETHLALFIHAFRYNPKLKIAGQFATKAIKFLFFLNTEIWRLENKTITIKNVDKKIEFLKQSLKKIRLCTSIEELQNLATQLSTAPEVISTNTQKESTTQRSIKQFIKQALDNKPHQKPDQKPDSEPSWESDKEFNPVLLTQKHTPFITRARSFALDVFKPSDGPPNSNEKPRYPNPKRSTVG